MNGQQIKKKKEVSFVESFIILISLLIILGYLIIIENYLPCTYFISVYDFIILWKI